MDKLMETVTVTREVPREIADLVIFVKYLKGLAVLRDADMRSMTDEELLAAARSYWQREHGED